MFAPLHSRASSIHLHSVSPTLSRTNSSSALAPGVPPKTARAPTRGMWSMEARRASVVVAREMSRVAVGVVVGGDAVDDERRAERWTSVGRCA
jgi:hypothetical protein